jgi:hypothetical protein
VFLEDLLGTIDKKQECSMLVVDYNKVRNNLIPHYNKLCNNLVYVYKKSHRIFKKMEKVKR